MMPGRGQKRTAPPARGGLVEAPRIATESGLDVARTLAAGTAPLTVTPTAAPSRIGRFTILDRLGEGAMGVVYSAYDELLDRKVAVKLLHDPDANAQLRLIREAQGMARVSHPNVVAVLEAGRASERVYVAMEFIRGVTLGTWLDAAPRGWPAIVDVFTQAGRGLAAAHAAGLVHRDFKPSNVMVDDTGRVRVLDFGLVRAAERLAPIDPATSSSHSFDVLLTHDDELVGTPAYMAPEQWRGQAVQPASDQFSFCVALYQALYGRHPFPVDHPPQLAQAVLQGRPREPPRLRGTPTWLAPVILRGLRADPKDRWPSMPALLAALAPPRKRWRRYLAAGALATTTAIAGFVVTAGEAEPPCSGAARELTPVWGHDRREVVAAALRAAVPEYAGALWPRVADELDRYAAGWAEVHRDACTEHLQGRTSDALFDRQMRCIERRLRALDEAVGALSTADAAVAARALEVAGELPRLALCRELEALASESPPPDDPALARQVAELRARMLHAEVLAHAGRLPAALDLATALVGEAEQVAYPPVFAEALLLRGRLGLNLPDVTGERADWLTRAANAGFAARADAVAVEALALRLFAMARLPDLAERALADGPLVLALLDRSTQPEVLRGMLLNNIGTVHLARQRPELAREAFAEALTVREAALGREHREVGYTLMNLAVATARGPERDALLTRALAILERELGPAHPEMLEARLSAAHLVDPAVGRTLLRPGCDALERFLADDLTGRTRCLFYLGQLAVDLADDTEADASFAAAAELNARVASEAPLGQVERAALAGHRGLATRTPEAAIGALTTTLADLPEEWWSRSAAAELRLLLGQNLLLAGRTGEARITLETALADYDALVAEDPEYARPRARARRSLAAALLELGERDAATALLAAVVEFYRGAGPAFAGQREATERLLATITRGE